MRMRNPSYVDVEWQWQCGESGRVMAVDGDVVGRRNRIES